MTTILDPSFYQKLKDSSGVKAIAIVDKNWGTSKNKKIPWSFSEDLAFFKKLTEYSSVIMGRETFFSIPNAPLVNRINCIISKNLQNIPGTEIFRSLEDVLKKYPNSWIIGGAEIYNYALENNLINLMIITQVHENFSADTFINKSLLQSFKKKVLFSNKKYDITSYLRV
ncbi:MAG: dihydrofolate reductase [Alphaproteobacteria bacterium]|nr:dihydrofolate reductase [Alphaproteobacteria bacterium]